MPRLKRISAASARERAGAAREFLALAQIELDEARRHEGRTAQAHVAATNAIHAGIAAADAICGIRLGHHASGQDHGQAVTLLETVRPDGEALARKLRRLTTSKSLLEYGDYCTSARAEEMVSAAEGLVAALPAHGM